MKIAIDMGNKIIFSKVESEIADICWLQSNELENFRDMVNLEEEAKTHISLWEVDRSSVSAIPVYDPTSQRWMVAKPNLAYILLAIEKTGGNEKDLDPFISFPSAMTSLIESIDFISPGDLSSPFSQGRYGDYSFRLYNLCGKGALKETKAFSVLKIVEIEDWINKTKDRSMIFLYFGFYISAGKIKFGKRVNLIAVLEKLNEEPPNLTSYKFLWELITNSKFVHPNTPDLRLALAALLSQPTDSQTNHRFTLDLDVLPVNSLELSDPDSAARETARRLAKMKEFEYDCSCVLDDNIFVSGYKVAADAERLASLGITHVVNCAGDFCENENSPRFCYKTFFIKDSKLENIECLFYESIEFIENAISKGGKVLVHCMQGVSRSVTLTLAYVMLKQKMGYAKAFEIVKKRRGIASPNIGFVSQLLFFEKRIFGNIEETSYPLVWVVGSHQIEDPKKVVVRLV